METVVYIKLQNDKNFRIKSNTTRMILNQLLITNGNVNGNVNMYKRFKYKTRFKHLFAQNHVIHAKSLFQYIVKRYL